MDDDLPEGVYLFEDYIDEEYEEYLLSKIKEREFREVIPGKKGREVQQYGYEYSYTTYDCVRTQAFPCFIRNLKWDIESKLSSIDIHSQDDYSPNENCFNQCIINKYEPGQGISPHTDHTTLFGDVVVSLSLGSDVIMEFTWGEDKRKINLKRRSLVVMSGIGRYQWKHSIPARKSDDGIKRGERISVTLRKFL